MKTAETQALTKMHPQLSNPIYSGAASLFLPSQSALMLGLM